VRPPILAIVGPGDGATTDDLRRAESLGELAAREGWVVLNGGVASGVMDAASRGARAAGGLVIGILPTADPGSASPHVTVPLITDMGQARNNIIVLSADAVAVCGMSPGTAVESALAIRHARPIVFVAAEGATRTFHERLAGNRPAYFVESPADAIEQLRRLFGQRA
jgi:uncharacterized protein (TIGR00725 family)